MKHVVLLISLMCSILIMQDSSQSNYCAIPRSLFHDYKEIQPNSTEYCKAIDDCESELKHDFPNDSSDSNHSNDSNDSQYVWIHVKLESANSLVGGRVHCSSNCSNQRWEFTFDSNISQTIRFLSVNNSNQTNETCSSWFRFFLTPVYNISSFNMSFNNNSNITVTMIREMEWTFFGIPENATTMSMDNPPCSLPQPTPASPTSPPFPSPTSLLSQPPSTTSFPLSFTPSPTPFPFTPTSPQQPPSSPANVGCCSSFSVNTSISEQLSVFMFVDLYSCGTSQPSSQPFQMNITVADENGTTLTDLSSTRTYHGLLYSDSNSSFLVIFRINNCTSETQLNISFSTEGSFYRVRKCDVYRWIDRFDPMAYRSGGGLNTRPHSQPVPSATKSSFSTSIIGGNSNAATLATATILAPNSTQTSPQAWSPTVPTSTQSSTAPIPQDTNWNIIGKIQLEIEFKINQTFDPEMNTKNSKQYNETKSLVWKELWATCQTVLGNDFMQIREPLHFSKGSILINTLLDLNGSSSDWDNKSTWNDNLLSTLPGLFLNNSFSIKLVQTPPSPAADTNPNYRTWIGVGCGIALLLILVSIILIIVIAKRKCIKRRPTSGRSISPAQSHYNGSNFSIPRPQQMVWQPSSIGKNVGSDLEHIEMPEANGIPGDVTKGSPHYDDVTRERYASGNQRTGDDLLGRFPFEQYDNNYAIPRRVPPFERQNTQSTDSTNFYISDVFPKRQQNDPMLHRDALKKKQSVSKKASSGKHPGNARPDESRTPFKQSQDNRNFQGHPHNNSKQIGVVLPRPSIKVTSDNDDITGNRKFPVNDPSSASKNNDSFRVNRNFQSQLSPHSPIGASAFPFSVYHDDIASSSSSMHLRSNLNQRINDPVRPNSSRSSHRDSAGIDKPADFGDVFLPGPAINSTTSLVDRPVTANSQSLMRQGRSADDIHQNRPGEDPLARGHRGQRGQPAQIGNDVEHPPMDDHVFQLYSSENDLQGGKVMTQLRKSISRGSAKSKPDNLHRNPPSYGKQGTKKLTVAANADNKFW